MHLRMSLMAALLAVGVTGCRAHTSVEGPGMNARREANLLDDAARTLGCAREALKPAFVESIQRNAHVYRVDGCGRSHVAVLRCTGVCAWVEAPKATAAAELKCESEPLQTAYVGNGNFTVSGCGRSVPFMYAHGRLQPASSDTPPPPPPPPAAP